VTVVVKKAQPGTYYTVIITGLVLLVGGRLARADSRAFFETEAGTGTGTGTRLLLQQVDRHCRRWAGRVSVTVFTGRL